MTQIIFCDFDGVIRHWNNDVLFEMEQQLNLPKGTTFKVAFAAENLIPAITGQISDEQWRSNTAHQLEQLTNLQNATDLVQAWGNSPATIDHQMFRLLKKLFPKAPLALVTNATSRLNADLAAHNLGHQFDFVINSSKIGVAKPDVGFYKEAVQKTNASVQTSVFIDDSLDNVKSAQSFGLNSFHFQGSDILQKEVEQWLTKK